MASGSCHSTDPCIFGVRRCLLTIQSLLTRQLWHTSKRLYVLHMCVRASHRGYATPERTDAGTSRSTILHNMPRTAVHTVPFALSFSRIDRKWDFVLKHDKV